MATVYWEGQVIATTQRDKSTITFDAATTYSMYNYNVFMGSASAGNITSLLTALVDLWNGGTHPLQAYITAAATGGNAVKWSSDSPGVPMDISVTESGGTGSWGTLTVVTAFASPNDWADADNWSGGAVPVSTDDVIFRDSAVDVRWGLDQAAVDLASLTFEQSYTGRVGLPYNALTTGADGETNPLWPEVREDYLIIGWDECRIGELVGVGAPSGSDRLKLDNDKVGASTTEVFNTAATTADGDLPAIRLLAGNASADVYVRSAPGGLGIAVDVPGETATVGDVVVSDTTPATEVRVGSGVTMTNFSQMGGNNIVRSAATVTLIECYGGDLAIEGDQLVTTLTAVAGTVRPHNVPSAGAAITTLNLDGGVVDGTGSRIARTWTSVNMREPGSELKADDNIVTITTLNEPDGPYTLRVG